ncbi:MAG: acetyl-CoA acetyltransferase [Acidimicrobiia bacterium]|nr:acetyl-CoA acetyltransferase [Acidimicrobiia bacterium]MDH5289445.1 acetyl-CoA acetyltransferase [Acidimicrobiia bacterium]
MEGRAVVVGVGESPYYKRGGASESEFQLACIAIRNAVEDAGLTMADVDGFASYMDRNEPVRLSNALGTGDLHFTGQTFGGGGNGTAAAVALADMAVSAGYAECVVVFRSLAQGQFHRYGQAGKSRRAGGSAAYTAPYGMLSAAQICAMQTTRWMYDHGVTQDSLAEVALACFAHAQHNPRAVRYGSPLTREEYHASRWIAEPFHLYDCCPENDGAAAIVVTTAERARDCAQPGVPIVAAAQGLAHRGGGAAFTEAGFPTAHYDLVARQLWNRAGVKPADVPVAQFYENFTGPVLMAIAEMGFCEPGEINDFVANGGIQLGGRLPINTSGGNLAEAYIHGFGCVVEAVRQMRGSSTCQVEGADLSLVVAGPGFAPGSAVLFGRDS